MRLRDEVLVWTGLLLFALWSADAAAVPVLPPLEQEIVNPSEVIFRSGVPYIDLGRGQLEALRTRRQNGQLMYYRLVRYDAEFGYLKEPEPEVELDPEVEVASISGSRASPSSLAGATHHIESRIKGNFEGWTGKTLFQLQNGEIWQQTDGRVRKTTAYSPRVTLMRRGFDYEMQVDGVSGTIMVRRR